MKTQVFNLRNELTSHHFQGGQYSQRQEKLLFSQLHLWRVQIVSSRYQGAHVDRCGEMVARLLIMVHVGNGSTGHPGKQCLTHYHPPDNLSFTYFCNIHRLTHSTDDGGICAIQSRFYLMLVSICVLLHRALLMTNQFSNSFSTLLLNVLLVFLD